MTVDGTHVKKNGIGVVIEEIKIKWITQFTVTKLYAAAKKADFTQK